MDLLLTPLYLRRQTSGIGEITLSVSYIFFVQSLLLMFSWQITAVIAGTVTYGAVSLFQVRFISNELLYVRLKNDI